MAKTKNGISSYHVGVAAEAIATAQFARCGINVSVQYGANQPEYDLLVNRGEQFMKVSVKGSRDGEWGLAQSLMGREKTADYQGANERWLAKHKPKTVMCFVQFKNVALDQLPRVDLATPEEVAARMRRVAKGRGDTVLHEHHVWGERARGAGTVEKILDEWKFSRERVEQLLGHV